MQPHELLDEYIGQIQLGNKMYDRAKAKRVYAKLTAPKTNGTFYKGDRVRGKIDPDGQVSFQVKYPELRDDLFGDDGGWSYRTPEELGLARTSLRPRRELIEMSEAFNSLLRNPDGSIRSTGAGLYYNRPISDHRARAYAGLGFVESPQGYQFLDNRRFTNNPTIAELLMKMDVEREGSFAEFLRQPLLARHPQLQSVDLNADRAYTPRAGIESYPYNPTNRASDEEAASFLGMTLAEYRAGNNSYYDDAPF